MRKRICLISFSPVYRDGRVLRQIEYLAPHYDLTVIGYGTKPGFDVEWIPIDRHLTLPDKVMTSLLLVAGRVVPAIYDYRYWHRPHYAQAWAKMQGRQFDAYYANEWAAVPLAVRAAAATRAPVVYDAHEYSPLEQEGNPAWMLFYSPMITYLLRRYTPRIQAAITVCQPIADRYEREFGFKPMLVLNTPRPVEVPDHELDPNRIQLVHHGSAQRDRRIEIMIEAMPQTDARYHLNLMLVDQEPGCLDGLKQLARTIAPERVTFLDPVPPAQIVASIARFDLGLSLVSPTSYNHLMSLPNKLFEAINAGLGVVVGQSPAMIDIIEKHGCGVATPSFEPAAIAATLNRLTLEEINQMRAASRRAAQVLNADFQTAQLVDLFRSLLAEAASG